MARTYEPIQSITVSGAGVTSFVFSGIPQTYTDLVFVYKGVGTGSLIKYIDANAGGIPGAAWSLYGLTSSSGAGYYGTSWVDIVNAGANWNMTIIDIMQYTNTNVYKTYLSRQYGPGISNELVTGSLSLTAAITTLRIVAHNNNFGIGSMATLYGIKAA